MQMKTSAYDFLDDLDLDAFFEENTYDNYFTITNDVYTYTYTPATTSNIEIFDIIDDAWISVILYCNVKDFLSLRLSCKHFNLLTNHKRYNQINKYWKHVCQRLCQDIDILNFETNDWFNFFISFSKFLMKEIELRGLDRHNIILSIWDLICLAKDETARGTFPMLIGQIRRPIRYNYNYNSKTADDDYGDIDHDHDKNINDLSPRSYPIISACKNDNIEVFKLLSKYFVDVAIDEDNYRYRYSLDEIRDDKYNDKSILEVIIVNQSYTIAKYLLCKKGIENCGSIDVNKSFGGSYMVSKTALALAASKLDEIMVQLLLKYPTMNKHGINNTNFAMKSKNTYAETPLHWAIKSIGTRDNDKGARVLKLLLNDERTNGNLINYNGRTPLRQALYDKCSNRILLLLINSPNVSVYKSHISLAKKRNVDAKIISALRKRCRRM